MKHFLSTVGLSEEVAVALMDRAAEFHDLQNNQVKKLDILRGKTIINLFFEDSTRTRSSFEIAGKWMSADTINISAKGSSTSKGESLRDTVRNIDAMAVDAVVMRHSSSGAAQRATEWVRASVVNAGDGTHEHPSQALLDAYTMRQHWGSLAGRRIAIIGDLTHSRVFRSNVALLTTLGAELTVVAPHTLLPSGVTEWARQSGFTVSTDLDEALAEPYDALMMLRVQKERMSGGFFPTPREYTVRYGLTAARWAAVKARNPETLLLHPGPMNRGLEIASLPADHRDSLILQQVSAGVAVRMAILEHVILSTEKADS